MSGRSSPRSARLWWSLPDVIARPLVTVVVAGVAVVVVGLLLSSDLPLSVRRDISGAVIGAAGSAVALACFLRARTTHGRRRRAWVMIGAAATCATTGNALLVVSGTSMGPRSIPSLADLALLGALLLAVGGVASYPRDRLRPTELLRMGLDGALIGGSIFFVASVTVFPAILGRGDVFELSRAIPLLVPVLDLVAATITILLLLRSGRAEASILGLTGAGFLAFAVSDFAAAVLTTRGPFSFGSVADLGWVIGWLLIGIAVWGAPAGAADPAAPRRKESSLPGTAAMFVVFVTAASFSLREARLGGMDLVPSMLWLLGLVGAVGRQVLLIVDNEVLRRRLERRVLERTREVRDISARSALLVDAVGEGIYGLDTSGVVTFVNPAGVRTLGYPAAELIGARAHEVFHADEPADGAHSAEGCYLRSVIADRSAITAAADTYLRADGHAFAVEVTVNPLVSDDAVLGAVAVFRDVTERREVDRLKGEFVSMVSHELRTPLTSIQGALRMLDAGTLGRLEAPAAKLTRIALDSSAQLTRLINDILDIERIGSGQVALELNVQSVADMVEAAVRQLRVLADRAEVRVVLGPVDGWVLADPDRINQLLVNLMGNAIKFSPPGRSIEIASVSRGTDVEVTVTDHGRGIPTEKLESVFERFEQVDSSDAREKGGSGLGLAICRSIVERHGGRIWAEHTPNGVGAVFRFTLPRSSPSEPLNGARLARSDGDHAADNQVGPSVRLDAAAENSSVHR